MPSPSPFIAWVQERLTAVYTSRTEDALTAALNELLQGATIVLNGKDVSFDEYRKVILSQRNLSFPSPSITFDKSLDVPTTTPGIAMSSSIRISFRAVVDFAFPFQERPGGDVVVTSSLKAVAEQILPVAQKEGSGETLPGIVALVKLDQVITRRAPAA